jgi:hypothetical protein
MKLRAALVALAVLVGGLVTAPQPAQAEETGIALDIDATYCGVTLTYTNNTEWPFWGDYKVQGDRGTKDKGLPSLPDDPADYGDAHNHGVAPGDLIKGGPLKGQTFGKQFNPVLLPPGKTVTVDVQTAGSATVWAGLRRGPEQDHYLGWSKVKHVLPCSEPIVTFEDICTGVKVFLANGGEAPAVARFSVAPVLPGLGLILELDPGLMPEPLLYGVSSLITVTEHVTGEVWEHEWTQPDDCEGTPTPTPAPSETPSETPPPATGVAGELPATGAAIGVLVVLACVMLGLGAAMFVRGRRRPLKFQA